ncbi:MAG: hypothetical protein KC646_16895 [Candidatus Cloacimonetes bacterium]|nr:hypothetical protein [Candidatus Cloacimonadota bacterium]
MQIIDRFPDYLKRLSSLSEDFAVELLQLRSFGEHKKAIRLIKDNSSISHIDKNLLLYRFCFEIKDKALSKKYLYQAKLLDKQNPQIQLEESYLNLDDISFHQCLQLHQSLFPRLSLLDCVSYISCELFHRNHSQSALLFLKNYHKEVEHSIELSELLTEISDKSKHDLYYHYYGDLIILSQLLAPVLLLILATIALFQSNSVPIIFEAIISLSFEPNLFFIGLKQILVWLFFVCAFLPMIRINYLVFVFNKSTPKLCNIQINANYLHIEEFHRIEHLELNPKPYFVSSDDNDFSYNSLIRFLPFVPNLHYIYAYSIFDKCYKIKALWGISNRFHHEKHQSSGSINMLGIRFAQVAFWFHKLKANQLLYIWIFILLSPMLLQLHFTWHYLTPLQITRNLLLLLVASLIIFKLNDWIPNYIKGASSHSIFKVNIIQPGILVIAFIYFYQVFSYFQLLGLIPSFLCTVMFYLIFLPDKLMGAQKEMNAIANQYLNQKSLLKNTVKIHPDCFLVHLCSEKTKSKTLLLIYKSQVSISKTVFGFHLYFKQLKGPLTLHPLSHFCILRSNDENTNIYCSPTSLSKTLDYFKVDFSQKYEFPPSKLHRNHVRMIVVCLLFGLWELTKWSLFSIGTPSEQNLSRNILRYINSHFYYSGSYYTHKVDMVPYELRLSEDNKSLILVQSRLPTYLEYETYLKKYVKYHPSQIISYPPKVKPYKIRFELFSYLQWHFYTKHKSFSSLRYSSIYKDYCKTLNSNMIEVDNKLLCGRKYNLAYELTNSPQIKYQLPKKLQAYISLQK